MAPDERHSRIGVSEVAVEDADVLRARGTFLEAPFPTVDAPPDPLATRRSRTATTNPSRTTSTFSTAADLVLATGMGGITDVFPRDAYDLLETLDSAHRLGAVTAMMGQGMGPIDDRHLQRCAAAVLRRVDLIALGEDRGLGARCSSGNSASTTRRITTTGDDRDRARLQPQAGSPRNEHRREPQDLGLLGRHRVDRHGHRGSASTGRDGHVGSARPDPDLLRERGGRSAFHREVRHGNDIRRIVRPSRQHRRRADRHRRLSRRGDGGNPRGRVRAFDGGPGGRTGGVSVLRRQVQGVGRPVRPWLRGGGRVGQRPGRGLRPGDRPVAPG